MYCVSGSYMSIFLSNFHYKILSLHIIGLFFAAIVNCSLCYSAEIAFMRQKKNTHTIYTFNWARCRLLNINNNEFLTQTRFALQSIFFFLFYSKILQSIRGTQRTLTGSQSMCVNNKCAQLLWLNRKVNIFIFKNIIISGGRTP